MKKAIVMNIIGMCMLVFTVSASAQQANVEKKLMVQAIEKADYRLEKNARADQELYILNKRNIKLENVSLLGVANPVTVFIKVNASVKGKKEVPLEKRLITINIPELRIKLQGTVLPRTGQVTFKGKFPDSLSKKAFAEYTLVSINEQMQKNMCEIIDDGAVITWETTKKAGSQTWNKGIVPASKWTYKEVLTPIGHAFRAFHKELISKK